MLRLEALLQCTNGTVEVIFVDDGSSDSSPIFLQAKARIDHRFKFIGLSRNFGQQVAITAGLDAARGDAVIVMDGDLQDPPELILAMIEKWQEGYEVVCAKRLRRDEDTYFKRATAHVFYHMINWLSSVRISKNVGDFRLLDRKVVDVFKDMPERTRFVSGMFSWLGFREAFVEFDRPSRPAGKTRYSALRLFRLAATYVVAFSDVPLRFVVWCGCLVSPTIGLWIGRHLLQIHGRRKNRRLDFNDRGPVVSLRCEHADDRHHRPLCWTNLCRSEATSTLRCKSAGGFQRGGTARGWIAGSSGLRSQSG